MLAAIETLIGKVLPRREIAGFEPRHRVPSTGPNKRLPKAHDAKGARSKTIEKKKKKKKKTTLNQSGPRAPAPTGSVGPRKEGSAR